jgi:hypothetical protein
MATKTSGSFNLVLNSHPILLTGDRYGIEDDLVEIIEQIRKECFAYAVEKKFAQAEIVFQE